MNFLISLLIFSLPLGVVMRITPYPNVSIYPQDLIAGLIFIFVLFKFVFQKEKVVAKKLIVMVLLFLLIGLISLIANSKYLSFQAFFTSFAYLLRFASYASIIFAFQFVSKDFRESVNAKLIIIGVIFALLGFVQYLFYPSLRNLYYLGWDEHLYRLFSTFLDPNFAGAFLVLLILLISNMIIQNSINKRKLIIFSILWVTILVSILLTYSRSAFIMLLVGIGTLLMLNKLYRFISVFGIILIALFFLFSNKNIEGLNPLRIASVEARVASAEEAFSIFWQNPILGVGFNAYRYALIRYDYRTEQGSVLSNADAGTDNSYLFVLATTGIVGFLIFIDFWINMFKILAPRINEPYVKVAIASICGILINTVFINSIFYTTISAWVFILVGLTVNKRR